MPESLPPTTADLINHVDEDPSTWELLISRYARLIYSIPRRYGMSDDDIADVFQAVSLTMVEKISQLHDPEKFGGWLATITRNVCFQMWREDRRFPDESLEEFSPPSVAETDILPEEIVVDQEEKKRLHEAMLELDERSHKLLSILFFDPASPSYEEIAEELGVPLGSVGPTRARSLEKLKKILEDG